MLLQKISQYQDAISVSILPHPITMFLLGFTLFALLVLFVEYKRMKSEFSDLKKNVEDTKSKLEHCRDYADNRVMELSKKLDSRVDKAILSVKKNDRRDKDVL